MFTLFFDLLFLLLCFNQQSKQTHQTNNHFYYTFMKKTINHMIVKQKYEHTLKCKTNKEDDELTLKEDNELALQDIYSEDEIYLMYRVIETETYGADVSSKTNVACVLLNRINHPTNRFGDSVNDVIMSPNQFAYFRKNISDSTIQALENAFKYDTTQGSLFFHSGKKTKNFNGATYIFTDDAGHHFYK